MRLHNAAFRSHHMGRLLHKIGVLLPVWMDGQSLAEASRHIEELCWSHLGYVQRPIFDGHLPPFMMTDANGDSVSLSMPTDPKVLAFKLAVVMSPPLLGSSPASANLSALARLLNLSPFESQWILWSYCVRRFGRAILPTVPLCNQEHGCEVLAMLSEMPVGDVRDAVASRRLHAWALLDGIGAYGETPSLLSNWLSATDKFADLIEQPYASDSDLLSALCQAHVSLMASR